MDFDELFGKSSEKLGGWHPCKTADEMLADLEMAEKDFNELGSCDFKVGDIVTPRKGCNEKGRGIPHKVIKTYETPQTPALKRGELVKYYDMQVLVSVRGEPLVYPVISKDYELFDPKKVEAGKSSTDD